MRNCIRSELEPVRWEMLHQERCQITIFTEREQVLLVQSINIAFCIVVDNAIGDDDRATFVRGTNSVHGETSWQTSDRSKQTLEGFGEMVRDVVLVNLNHRPPRAFFVVEFRLSTDADNT